MRVVVRVAKRLVLAAFVFVVLYMAATATVMDQDACDELWRVFVQVLRMVVFAFGAPPDAFGGRLLIAAQ